MFEFFRNLFAPERSSETAKERLKLVLLSDHLSLAPDTVEALKRDLLEVISRYVEIDAGHADVTFEQRPHEVAMLASIPITGVRERTAQLPAPSLAAPATVEPVQVAEATSDAPSEASTSEASTSQEAGAEAAVDESTAPVPARSANAGPPRRRRRKKSAAARALARAQHAPPASGQSIPGVGSA